MRVVGQRLRRRRRRPAIRGARDDLPDRLLLAPALLHEIHGEPVEQVAVLWDGGARTEVVGRLHEALAEERLPEPVHRHAGRQRRAGIDEPFRKGQSRWIGRRRERMQAGWHVRLHLVLRLVPRATVEEVRGATLRDRPRRGVHDRRGRVRGLRPRGRDLVVEGREVGDRLPPRAEQRPAISVGPLGGRLLGGEDRAVVDRQRRGRRGLREADAAAAEHRLRAMRNVSARPAERDPQLRAGGIVERLFKLHDRHRRLVLEEMAAVGPPGRLLVGVDHVCHRPDRHGGRGTIFLRSVGPRPGHCLLRLRKVGGGVDELDLLPILRVGLLHLNLQPTDRPQAVATRAVHEQVAVGERLELQASGPREVGRGLEDVLGVAVADH